VSLQHVASIVMVEEEAKQESSVKQVAGRALYVAEGRKRFDIFDEVFYKQAFSK
jgi:hypothetical protein